MNTMKFVVSLAFILVTTTASARETVTIVGSSTLAPLADEVVGKVGAQHPETEYALNTTGTVGGIALFCKGFGDEHPDILNASRRMSMDEVQNCYANGVKDIVEIKIGYDGITLAQAQSSENFALTARDIYLALAKVVPDPEGSGRLVANPYVKWSDVDASLPDKRIAVLGPPKTSGTRDMFAALAMESGCSQFDAVMAVYRQDRKQFEEVCRTLRDDGAYVEAGENDDELAAEIAGDDHLIGIFGFHYLEANQDKLKGIEYEETLPTLDSIRLQLYKLARPLFVYYKKSGAMRHAGVKQYIDEITSDEAWSEVGYLQGEGLIPMSMDERHLYAHIAQNDIAPGCPPFCR